MMKYEDMKTDLSGTLKKAMHFLELKTNHTRLNCLLQNSEGQYHRPRQENFTDPYTTEMLTTLDTYVEIVDRIMKDRLSKQN